MSFTMRETEITRSEWAFWLLAVLGAPITPQNVLAIVAWESAENTGAEWNPLATTEPAPGAGDWNSAGVKTYRDLWTGLSATVATLDNGLYGAILGALSAGDNATAVCSAVAHSPWGTGRLALEMVQTVEAHPANYYGVVLGAAEVPVPDAQTTAAQPTEAAVTTAAQPTEAATCVGIAPAPVPGGYWLVWSDGTVTTVGNAASHGSPHLPAGAHAVGITSMGDGYVVADDGGAVYPLGFPATFV